MHNALSYSQMNPLFSMASFQLSARPLMCQFLYWHIKTSGLLLMLFPDWHSILPSILSHSIRASPGVNVWRQTVWSQYGGLIWCPVQAPTASQSSFSAFTEVTHYTRMLLLVKSVDCQDYRHQTGRGSMCSAYHGVSNSQHTAKHIGSLSTFTKDGTSKTPDIPGPFLSIIKKLMSRWQSACLVVQHL